MEKTFLRILMASSAVVMGCGSPQEGPLDIEDQPRIAIIPADAVVTPPPDAVVVPPPDAVVIPPPDAIVMPPPDAISRDASPPDAFNCQIQPISQRSFPPDTYPEIMVSSPFSAQVPSFTAVHGSLQFFVDMPTSLSSPYQLGVDLTGTAIVCPMYDPATGQTYDQITLSMSWAPDSGGIYNIYHGYTSYIVGLGPGSPVVQQSLYEVDAATRNAKAGQCLGGASEEHAPFARDLYLTPQAYVNSGDLALAYSRGAYVPWTGVTTINDMINATNARFNALGRRVTLVLDSHGNVDYWALPGTAGLTANNANVVAYGAGVIGHVERITFESCCTAKGFSNGARPNVIASLSDAVTAVGQQFVTVCGWNHMASAWFRRGGFHVGNTKGDVLTCGTGP